MLERSTMASAQLNVAWKEGGASSEEMEAGTSSCMISFFSRDAHGLRNEVAVPVEESNNSKGWEK
jgi:hypothetical protein